MATKTRYAPGGAHTAGIYSDMTVDGPEIGTLVVVIDRAKNLPNRKSMGKQDPYCAARLAKEAHKTDTDRRGGQTPRWDQELRFTVRESPDYTQLKVSVFNDDKKTELIGETWISLESILVHGGGRNDIWHNLNCKGKYAGEIRIELTYYDTRPREDHIQQRKQSAQNDGTPSAGSGKEGMSGPRQMNPTKKRPLPADPTASSPLPHTSPQPLPVVQQHAVEVPDNDLYAGYPTQQSQNDPRQISPLSQQYHRSQISSEEGLDLETRYQYPSPEQFGRHGSEVDVYERQQALYPAQSSEPDYLDRSYVSENQELQPAISPNRYNNGNQHNEMPDITGNIDPRLLNQPQHSSITHSDLMNEGSIRNDFTRSPRSGQNPYEASPSPYAQPAEATQQTWARTDHFSGPEDDQPPAPPTHRHSAPRSAMPVKERDPYSSFPTMAPLNTRIDRGGNFPDSSINKARSSISSVVSPISTSPTSQQQYPPHDAVSAISSYPGPRQRRSHSPIRESIRDREVYGDSMPPSLTPGYDPGIADEESERLIREQQMIEEQATRGPIPRYQQAAAVPIQQPRAQHVPRGFESITNRKGRHRYSAPIPPTALPTRSQPISPNPPAILRKSLSPQPTTSFSSTRQPVPPPSVPFNPDSFDIYNPTLPSATTINTPSARYNTPAEAAEVHLQHTRARKLGDGPIIGSDGRVIDPSDHLPTDTWAPEPEQKPPRKPEVTIRFRQNPQQPPRQPLREARPNALPSYPPPATEAAPPTASGAARTRLQKKTRPAVAVQPNSSPMLPSSAAAYHAAPLRGSASEYPLRGGDAGYGGYHQGVNGGGVGGALYGGGSSGRAAGGVPPPVPGKVPLGSAEDELSEEIRRIDIGVGRGGRTRGRFGVRDV